MAMNYIKGQKDDAPFRGLEATGRGRGRVTGSEGDTGQWPAAILLEGNFERPRLWLGIIVGETRTLKKEIAGATEEHLELVWKVGTRKRMLRSEGGKVPVFRSENTITTCDLREGHVRDRVGRAPLWAQAWNVVLFLVLYVANWRAAGGFGSTLRSSTW